MSEEKLSYWLSSLKKNELVEIADFFEFSVSYRAKKEDLVRVIASNMIDYPMDWLDKLPERDMEMMLELVECGVDHRKKLDISSSFSIVELLKLVNADYFDDGFRIVTLPRPLADTIAPYAKKVFEENTRNGRYTIEKVILGYLSIFGVISGEDLVDILFRDLEIDDNIEHINDMISRCPAIKIYREFYDGVNYFIAPELYDIEYVINKRKELKQEDDYKYYPWLTAIDSGSRFPSNCFGLDTKEGKALEDVLDSLDYNAQDKIDIIHEIWYRSQFAGDESAGESLFECISDRQDYFSSFEEYKKCVDILTAYANSLPKWVLKGKSANEANLMKISIKVDNDDNDDENPLFNAPQYQCTALCNTSDKEGWAWMILSKSDKEALKLSKTVIS